MLKRTLLMALSIGPLFAIPMLGKEKEQVDPLVFQHMPSAQQAIAGVMAKDATETVIKQVATLETLRRFIQFDYLVPDHKTLPIETRLMDDYRTTGRALFEALLADVGAAKADRMRTEFAERVEAYCTDEAFKQDVVNKLLDPVARDGYARIKVQRMAAENRAMLAKEERLRAEERARGVSNTKLGSGATTAVAGLALAIVAIALLVRSFRTNGQLNRFEFEHRNSNGVLEFDSWEHKLQHDKKRARARMAAMAGFVLFMIAFGVLLMGGADLIDVLEK